MAPPPIPIDPLLDSWHTSDPPRSADLDISPLSASGLSLSSDHPRNISNALDNANNNSPDHSSSAKPLAGSDIEPDPLLRFWREKENPWSSQRIGGGVPESPKPPMDLNLSGNTRRSRPPFPQFDLYQASPRPEGEGSNPATFPVDSGYGTRSAATRSVRSAGYGSQSYERQSLPEDVAQYGFHPSEQALYSIHPMVQESPYAPVRPPVGETQVLPGTDPLTCQQPSCDFVAKNFSEAR